MSAVLDTRKRARGAGNGPGHEARAQTGDHAALKLWLRMLSCVTEIEAEQLHAHLGALRAHVARDR